jgi:hypothetical protein
MEANRYVIRGVLCISASVQLVGAAVWQTRKLHSSCSFDALRAMLLCGLSDQQLASVHLGPAHSGGLERPSSVDAFPSQRVHH